MAHDMHMHDRKYASLYSLTCLADRDIFVCIPAVEGEFFSLDKKEMAAEKSCPLRETISPSLAASNYLSPR